MSTHHRSRGAWLAAAFFLCLTVARGQGVIPQGGEINLLGSRVGDQVWPSLALNSSGGLLLWEDNALTDGKTVNVGGTLLNGSLSRQGIFRANKITVDDHIKPQALILHNGNVLSVWESKVAGTPDIYARFGKKTNFFTADVRVNTYITDQQVDPAAAALPDGGAIVVWSSFGQDGSGWGVFARKLTAAGAGATPKEFQVNQFTRNNQRSPAVTALAGGNYAITWVSEMERSAKSVDIYARIYSSAGVPLTDEFLVNSSSSTCANPALAPLGNGGFFAAWSQQDALVYTNGWDVWGRAFTASGMPAGKDFRINTHLFGDQYRPKLAASPSGVLAVWTSLGQDGDHEGVFGRFIAGGTQASGAEFQVNTTWINRQMHPAVAWNGSQFLVVYTSFAGTSGFDLLGQVYVLNP
jgi:hypothetical protein